MVLCGRDAQAGLGRSRHEEERESHQHQQCQAPCWTLFPFFPPPVCRVDIVSILQIRKQAQKHSQACKSSTGVELNPASLSVHFDSWLKLHHLLSDPCQPRV